MKKVYRLQINCEKKKLIECIIKEMGIENRKGYILFDDSNYEDYKNPNFKNNKAYYMNVKKGGVEEMCPKHVLELQNKPDCEHLIWLSKDAGESKPNEMAWIFSHECQHLIQGESYPDLSQKTEELKKIYRKGSQTKKQLDIPKEFDADLTAKKIVSKLFGEKASRTYMDNDDRFKGFEDIKNSWSGNPMEETIAIIGRCNK